MDYSNQDNLMSTVKEMTDRELELFAVALREELIKDVSRTGGHLASNLGVVELTLAIHRVFDPEKDRIVWDVGHQTYVHKILTGRRYAMKNLRQLGGISGFPKRSESITDAYDSGHSGTSISAAYGYARARDLMGADYHCVAVIGDGSLTGGVAYEALNNAGASKTGLIVILNDNQMSIHKNVGGIAKHLQSLRTSDGYRNFKAELKKATSSHPAVRKGLENMRKTLKYAIVPGVMFEEMGFKYYGPIDGHNIAQLTEVLETAKEQKRPVLVHVVTKKGKGFVPAEKNPGKYHGVGPFKPGEAIAAKKIDTTSYSAVFGSALTEEASLDSKVVAVSAAMIDGTGLDEMQEKFPGRVFDAGIAEQHAVSFAAGLALGGLKPVVAIYSTFLQRAYDQILSEVCLQNLPVVFAVDRAGVTGQDGETHQGCYDIAYLSSMPNMTVLAPKDGPELRAMLHYALSLGSPVAIRYPRAEAPDLSSYAIAAGCSHPQELREGKDMAIIACGSAAADALETAEIMAEKGIEAAVYNLRVIKPLNEDFLKYVFNSNRNVVTMEDGDVYEGVGTKIASLAASYGSRCRIKIIGWPDAFIEHGKQPQLKRKYGLAADQMAETLEDWFEEQN